MQNHEQYQLVNQQVKNIINMEANPLDSPDNILTLRCHGDPTEMNPSNIKRAEKPSRRWQFVEVQKSCDTE